MKILSATDTKKKWLSTTDIDIDEVAHTADIGKMIPDNDDVRSYSCLLLMLVLMKQYV